MKLLVLLFALICTPALAQTKATTSAVESSHVFCTVPCQVYGGQVNNTNASARWVMMFDATTAPSNGAVTGCTTAVTTRPCIIKWYQIAANSTLGIWDPFAFQGASRLPVSSGLVLMCSSTGPFTLTATADCTFSFETQ